MSSIVDDDDMTYRCYLYNRQRNMGVTEERWKAIFPEVEKLEARLRAEYEVDGAGRIVAPKQAVIKERPMGPWDDNKGV